MDRTRPSTAATSSSTSRRPPPRLVIFGAVEFATHLSAFAKVADWRAYVVDPRARFATRERFPDAVDVVAGWPDAAFEQLGAIDPATYLAVLTHDPKLDDAVLLMALKSDAKYIGAMGSKRAQKERRERLMEHGVTDEELARISAPGRPRPRRDGRARDGAVDHGRVRRRALRARRRPALPEGRGPQAHPRRGRGLQARRLATAADWPGRPTSQPPDGPAPGIRSRRTYGLPT